jgi:hypothetical protein
LWFSARRTDLGQTLSLPAPQASRLRAYYFGEESLGCGIAAKNAILPALFVIQDELHRDARTARPLRVGWSTAVAAEIARIGLTGHEFARCGPVRMHGAV